MSAVGHPSSVPGYPSLPRCGWHVIKHGLVGRYLVLHASRHWGLAGRTRRQLDCYVLADECVESPHDVPCQNGFYDQEERRIAGASIRCLRGGLPDTDAACVVVAEMCNQIHNRRSPFWVKYPTTKTHRLAGQGREGGRTEHRIEAYRSGSR